MLINVHCPYLKIKYLLVVAVVVVVVVVLNSIMLNYSFKQTKQKEQKHSSY